MNGFALRWMTRRSETETGRQCADQRAVKRHDGWTFRRMLTLPESSKPLYLTVNLPPEWFERK